MEITMSVDPKNYALIKDGAIQNVIVADEAFLTANYQDYTWVDLTNLDPCPGIGWTQNEDGSFTNPNAPVIPPEPPPADPT